MRFRSLFAIAAILAAGMLGSAYYLEYVQHLEPCPLCLLQRYVMWLLTGVLLLAALHNPRSTLGRYFYSMTTFFLSSIGILIASRHVWLQHLPKEQLPNCSAGLERLMEFYPLHEVLTIVLTASGECAHKDFSLLGITLAEWSLLAFIGFAIFAIVVIILERKRRI